MSYTREEQETVIRCNGTPNADWEIYSCIPKHVRKLTSLAEEWGVEVSTPHDGGIIVTLPSKAISFRKPSTRVMTEEQREAARERFKKMWEERAEEDEEN